MADVSPPHDYVPRGPVETQPFGDGYQPAEVRREAFAAVLDGVPLGAYDKRMIEWLVQLDDTSCRTLASVMWRCRLAAPPGAVTKWGVRYPGPDGAPGPVQPYYDEQDARDAQREVESLDPSRRGTVVSRQAWTGPWTRAPEREDDHG